MKPPLVKTTATWPVSARDGELKPMTLASRTAAATRAATFLDISLLQVVYTDLL
jgi:hypothetical protein